MVANICAIIWLRKYCSKNFYEMEDSCVVTQSEAGKSYDRDELVLSGVVYFTLFEGE